jgi:hypothetical protein
MIPAHKIMQREVLLHDHDMIGKEIDMLIQTRLYGANATRSR